MLKPLDLTTLDPHRADLRCPARPRLARPYREIVKRWMTGPAEHSLIEKSTFASAEPPVTSGRTEFENRLEIASERIVQRASGWPEGRSTVTSAKQVAARRSPRIFTQEARDAAMQRAKGTSAIVHAAREKEL